MSIIMIAAVDQNGAIGRDNQLLAHLPDDMAFFRKTTTGQVVVMGRKTYDSLPVINGRRMLPNRVNVVLSRDTRYMFKPPVATMYTMEEALDWADAYGRMSNPRDTYIIGGGEIYKQFMPHADKLYVTHIKHAFEGADTFFPEIDENVWACTNAEIYFANERNEYDFTICTYERITDIEEEYSNGKSE